ncbi:MAG: Xaa-Pro peptidase family protein [Candidatus Hadarchaeales archaeon]
MERVRKLQEKMEEYGLDVFIAFKNHRYLAGSEAGKAVIVPCKGKPILICSRLEFDRVKRESWIKDVRAFSGWKSPLRSGESIFFGQPWELVINCLEELGAKVVGYDQAPPEFISKLRMLYRAGYKRLPKIVEEMRMMKDSKEIEIMKKAANLAILGMKRIHELLSPGVSELELAAEAEHVMRKSGGEGTPFPTIVASGENSWLPHAGATDRRIKKEDIVVVDLGCYFEGYASDMTRTFVLGHSRKFRKLVQIVREAQAEALKRVRGGIKASDVDLAAREFIRRKGLLRFYLHGTGHGVGLDIHEPPSLSPTSQEILQEGMVITVEPGVYVKGVGGARWEDMVIVKEEGFEKLTEVDLDG